MSATSFTALVELEKRELTMTPANTRERVVSMRLRLEMATARATAKRPKKKEDSVMAK